MHSIPSRDHRIQMHGDQNLNERSGQKQRLVEKIQDVDLVDLCPVGVGDHAQRLALDYHPQAEQSHSDAHDNRVGE